MSKFLSLETDAHRRRCFVFWLLLTVIVAAGSPTQAAPKSADVKTPADAEAVATVEDEASESSRDDRSVAETNSVPPPVAVIPLSVGPSEAVRYPDDRPTWLDEIPGAIGTETRRSRSSSDPASTRDGRIDHWPVVTEPCETAQAAADSLAAQCRGSVRAYVEQMHPDFTDFDALEIRDDWIDEAVVTKRYSGTVENGAGEVLHEAAAMLSFDPSARDVLRSQVKAPIVAERLVGLGVATLGLLVSLVAGTVVFGAISRRVAGRNVGP